MKDSFGNIYLNDSNPVKNLSRGLSGCPIVMNPSGSVTKYSSSIAYNERLLRQVEKQVEFYSRKLEYISCPRVVNIKKSDIFSFEMDYISGSNYIDFLGYASPEYIDFFICSIMEYLDETREKRHDVYGREEFCKACIGKVLSLDYFPDYSIFFSYLIGRIENIDYKGVDKTFCHGDLTLSNVLFTQDAIFFLDFLDSYVESWIVDLIKLKQDLFYLWGLYREKDVVDLRSVQVSFHIWEGLLSRYQEVVGSEEFKIMESINFLRILPYAKTQRDLLILEKIIKKTPLYEEFNNTHGGKII